MGEMGEMGNSGPPVWRISCDCLNSVMRKHTHWPLVLLLCASLLIVSCTQPTLAPVPTPNETQVAALEARISKLETEKTAPTTLEDKLSQKETRIAELEAMISQLETEQTAPATAGSEFSQEIVDKARAVGIEARKSVVYLEVTTIGGRSGQATAWFLEGGLLITAGHVFEDVEGAVTIKGHTIDGDTFSVEVIYSSLIPGDIAILRTDYTKAPGLPVGSSGGLKEGDPLVQVGHPGGMGNWVITLGELVRGGGHSVLFGTVPTAGGMSGSPVLTLDGKVVGMTTGSALITVGGRSFEPGATPPSNSEVYLSIEELRPSMLSTHEPIELVLEQVAEWTE